MATGELDWRKTKDAIVLGLGALLVTLLIAVLRGQQETGVLLAEVRKDLAVLSAETARDRMETRDLKEQARLLNDRVARLENHR